MRYIPLIWKNGLRNRRRSILTIASIAVSLCILGVLMAFYRGLFMSGPSTPAQAMRLVVHHKVSITQALPMSYEEQIARVPGVKAVEKWQWFGGTYKDASDTRNFFPRFAIEPDKLFQIHPDATIPDDQLQAFIHDRTACVAGKDLADRFGWKLGQRITIKGDIFPVDPELKLVGIYESTLDSSSLFFNYDYINEALKAKNYGSVDQIGAFQVMADSPEDVPRVAKAIDALFANSPAPTLTETEQAFTLAFVSFLGNLKLYLLIICGAITFTILLVSANTISMSVRERVREVGVLKTLGFTSESILAIIIGESAVISIIGGAIGCVLAALLCSGVSHSPGAMGFVRAMKMTPSVALICIAAAAAIGLVSSLVPAWSASRTPIVQALRHTG